jgi:hypothetical protein
MLGGGKRVLVEYMDSCTQVMDSHGSSCTKAAGLVFEAVAASLPAASSSPLVVGMGVRRFELVECLVRIAAAVSADERRGELRKDPLGRDPTPGLVQKPGPGHRRDHAGHGDHGSSVEGPWPLVGAAGALERFLGRHLPVLDLVYFFLGKPPPAADREAAARAAAEAEAAARAASGKGSNLGDFLLERIRKRKEAEAAALASKKQTNKKKPATTTAATTLKK